MVARYSIGYWTDAQLGRVEAAERCCHSAGRERTAMHVKKPMISRAKRSAAMACWAGPALGFGMLSTTSRGTVYISCHFHMDITHSDQCVSSKVLGTLLHYTR